MTLRAFSHTLEYPLHRWHAYRVDDAPPVYGPGLYPFRQHSIIPLPRRDHEINATRTKKGPAAPSTVRLSPSSEHRAWRNEYVSLSPGAGSTVTMRTSLFVTTLLVLEVQIDIDLTSARIALPSTIPWPLHEQALTKARRAKELIERARAERDDGAVVADKVLRLADGTRP